MRVNLQKNSKVFSVNDDFARLMEIKYIDNVAYFVYEISYTVNSAEAIRNQSFVADIVIMKNVPYLQNTKLFDKGFDTDYIVDNLKKYSSRQKDNKRKVRDYEILVHKSDLSKALSNNINQEFKVTSTTNKQVLRTENKKISDLRNENRFFANIQTNKHLNEKSNGLYSKSEFQNISKQILNDKFIDPATFIGGRSNTIIPVKNSRHGFVGKKRTNTRELNDEKYKKLHNNFLNKTSFEDSREVSNESFMPILYTDYSSEVTIKEKINIPVESIGHDDFIITFKLYNSKALLVQQYKKIVLHNIFVQDLYVPTRPPMINVFSSLQNNRNILAVQQLDKYATELWLLRKINYPSRTGDDGYRLVKKIPLSITDNLIYLEDKVASRNSITYRVLAANAFGETSGEFNSVIIKPKKISNISGTKSFFKSIDDKCLIEFEQSSRSLIIKVSNIPTTVSSFKIIRKNSDQTLATISDTVFSTKLLVNGEIKVEDINVKPGRVYQYMVYFYYNNGREKMSQSSLTVKHSPISVSANRSNIIEPKIINSEEGVDISFDINISATPKALDLVKNAIEKQNIQTEFETSLLEHREQYGDLLFTRVTRTDVSTGEIEDFGVISNNTFSDYEEGKNNNVSRLERGKVYKYCITTFARSAETMLSKYQRTVSGSNGTIYSFYPYKFLHPITLGTDGTIVTDSSFKRNHSENQFTIGNVIDEKYITVDLSNSLSEIIEAKATKKGKDVLLRWKISGESTNVDHFIIGLEILGARTIVGKAHAFSDTNSFSFVDILDNNEHGELRYIITPIYSDYTSGVEFLSNYIVID